MFRKLLTTSAYGFDELVASKKESAPGPDGIPYSVYRCAAGLGPQILFNVYNHVLEGGTIPEDFAELDHQTPFVL